LSGITHAHHSTLGFYYPDQTIEIEGIVTSISWRNPHVRFVVAMTDESGVTIDWKLETSAISVLRTRGLDQEFMKTGDRIRVAGNPSRRDRPELSARNILLSDGTEVLIARTAMPYFTDNTTGRILDPRYRNENEEAARRQADGIFRVWSTVVDDPAAFPMFKGRYPLKADAAKARANWNPGAEELLNCWEKSMPMLMITPVPIEFSRSGDDILIRFEEDDAERLVRMNPANIEPPDTYSLLGYSTGRWEGDTLVVETVNIDAPHLDDRGAPQSKSISLVEQFTLNEDQERLDYRITISDPETFTEPFDLTRYWIWRPGMTVQEWNCENQG
jgi:hypothetical protein